MQHGTQKLAGNCKKAGSVLVHVQLAVHQDPEILFRTAAFQLGILHHILVHGATPPQLQDFTLLVELHEVPVSPLFQVILSAGDTSKNN